MRLFYLDESGDIGFMGGGSPTSAYVLSALIVSDKDWLSTLNQIVSFRRYLKKEFGLRLRDELKASYLIHGTGPFSELGTSEKARMKIYKMALKLQPKLETLTTWAIVINKRSYEASFGGKPTDILEVSWRYMIQRIERYTTKSQEPGMVFPDEGNNSAIRKIFRRMRRHSFVQSYYGTGALARPAAFLVEDPNFRTSASSYFIQLADLNAYAAYRHLHPEAYFGSSYWDLLGDSRLKAVNSQRGGPVGIVSWP